MFFFREAGRMWVFGSGLDRVADESQQFRVFLTPQAQVLAHTSVYWAASALGACLGY